MPTSSRRQHYNSPTKFAAASVSPRRTGATETLGSFNVDGYQVLAATLRLHETVVTALTGTNNDFSVTARKYGSSPLTIALVDPSANNATLSVTKTNDAIAVSLATGSGGAITTTAQQVVNLLNTSNITKGHVVAALAPSNDGTGVVTALAATALADWVGTTPTLDVTLETTYDGTNWVTVDAFGQKDTVADGSESNAFVGLGSRARWKATVGGTGTPGVAYSIVGEGTPR